MCHQQHIKYRAAAVQACRPALIPNQHCSTVLTGIVSSLEKNRKRVWNMHLQHKQCEQLSHNYHIWLRRKRGSVCENFLACLPRCRTAQCVVALYILLSLITAFQWHLTSFANVTCEDRAPFVWAATTDVLLRLFRALHRYFWMSVFSSCCSVTAANRTSANPKLSHRPQTLPVHVQNKLYKREKSDHWGDKNWWQQKNLNFIVLAGRHMCR